jgi:RNA polymerase sigma factor (sigma-70 family)
MASAALGSAYRHLRDLFAAGSTLGLEDGQLLARYSRSNDEAAFEALVSRHGPMVLATCRAVLRNEHDVEDAFQATFLVLARKAGSIRTAETLGGWLHRVAYRASVQASLEGRKRRRKEAEAAMARRESPRPESDLAALLHEEIDRLPRGQRLPIVLCDLEGLSYEEAARHLGWTLPSLRHRLADGRQKLKSRLARRGVLPSMIGAAPISKALAAVPPALVRSTVALAAGATPQAGVVLLTHFLLRGMLMTRIKIAGSAALASLALASAGVIALAGQPQEPPGPATSPEPSAKAADAAKAGTSDGLIEVRGIVVDPVGKPVAGAKVLASRRESMPEATSGPDGRFRLLVPPLDPLLRDSELGPYPRLSALAPGFGLGWAKDAFRPGPSGEVTIRLVEEGPPVEGRILDLEGRPVAGARVQVRGVFVVDRVGFAEWRARAKSQGASSLSEAQSGTLLGFSASIEAETGPDGRFRLLGLGRERVASLFVTGPTIADTSLSVMTDDGPEIRSTPRPNVAGPRPDVFHARKFEAVVGPTRPVEGVVRDKDTGRPIEGLRVKAAVDDGRPLAINAGQTFSTAFVARTDADGRYRLLGMPTSPAYRLLVDHAPDRFRPYVARISSTPSDLPAAGPVRFDVAMRRGVVVRGRVTDKATGRPVTGYLDPLVFEDNPALLEFPDYAQGRDRPRTDPDGRFELVTLPGRGLLAFKADRDDYVNALGAEAIAGFDPQRAVFPTRGGGSLAINYHILAEVNLDPGAESATVDLQVDPGRSLELSVVDPDGRPVEGLKTLGVAPMPSIEPQASSVVKVRAIDPTRPRRVYVYQFDRKLVGSTWLKGDEVGPMTVRLVPWGTIVGRVLDPEGNPLASQAANQINPSLTTPEFEGLTRPNPVNSPIRTDKDGRFRIEALVPGLRYSQTLGRSRNDPGFKDVVVAPGEVKDLGDLKPPTPRP